MTLSFERAMDTAGLRGNPGLNISGDVMSFIAPNRAVFAFPMDYQGASPTVYDIGENMRVIPFITARRGDTKRMCMSGVLDRDDGELVLEVTPWNSDVAIDVDNDVIDDMLAEVVDREDTELADPPLNDTAPHEGLNRSTLEPLLWSEIIAALGGHSIKWRVDPRVLGKFTNLSNVAPAPQADTSPLELDCSDKGEVPGVRLDRVMHAEYSDAQWARDKKLVLKDICGVARASTCFGGDDECTYDDYVFARANRMCYPCATQSQVRDKFKVK